MRPFAIVVVAALLAASSTSAAGVKDSPPGRAHFNAGKAKFAARQYEQAAKEFIDAFVANHSPEALYHAGLSYEKSGDPGRATALFKLFLTESPNAPETREVEKKLAQMAPKVATVTLVSLEGSAISIDGVAVGRAPVAPQYLIAGKHTFSATRDGYTATTIEVTFSGGEGREVKVEPAAPVAARLDPPTAVQPPESDNTAAPEAVRAPDKPVAPSKPRPKWLWPVVGAGAAVVVAAVLVTVLTLTLGTDYSSNARAGCPAGCIFVDGSMFR